MAENGRGNRRLPNWIESFIQFSENIQSPKIFRKWAAISILGSILERRVWTYTSGSCLFANLYIILVGPPGVGKSQILSKAEAMLRSIKEIHVAPTSLTTASLIDTVHASSRTIIYPTPFIFNSLQVIASELGVFLPAYDPAFMNTLTKLYDGEFYEERRRTGKVNHIRIESPQLSILGGTTPSYLNSFLPEGAWDQGFTSRTILIYHEDVERGDPFADANRASEDIYKDLVYDLTVLKDVGGIFEWEEDAKAIARNWIRTGEKPVPAHAKMKHYNSRRWAHLAKLSMIASLASSSILRITGDSIRQAMEWLFEAEALIPTIFLRMGISIDSRTMEDLHYYIKTLHKKNGEPVSEHLIINFLKDRTTAQNIVKIVDIMRRSKKIEPIVHKNLPHYLPLD